jgi:cardiolipin synthase (CMP-forming)
MVDVSGARMTKREPEKLVSSITFSLLAYCLFQIGLYSAVLFINKIGFEGLLLFIGVTVTFHGLLFLFLYFSREGFVLEESGHKLDRINIANRITLIRISTLPTILFMIILLREYRVFIWVMTIIVFAFLTDLLDGKVSRALHQITRIGRMLDSISDYCLLFVISIIYYYFELLPLWFFILILFRLVFQVAGMGLLLLIEKKPRPETSLCGKIAIAVTMGLYAIEILRFLPFGEFAINIAANVLEYIAGVVLVVSVFDKAIYFRKRLAEIKKGDSKAI